MPRPQTTYRRKGSGTVRSKRMRHTKKPTKKQLVSARAPIVETKHKSFEPQKPLVYHNLTGEFITWIPDAWENHQQGLSDSDIIGSSFFMKYLNMKMHIEMNGATSLEGTGMKSIPHAMDLKVYIGWCKLPQNLAPAFETTAGPPSTTKGVVYNYNPQLHIQNYIKADLDNPLESLDRDVFKIDKQFTISGLPRTAFENGLHPEYRRKNVMIQHSWKPFKKLKLQPVTAFTSGLAPADLHWSPCNLDGQWIPFMAIHSPSYGTFPAGACPTYIIKSDSYFTDS